MVMNFLDAAADLVSLGFKVFPLVPGRKLPLINAWQKQASDDLEIITAWSKQCTKANIAIVTGTMSGVIVIDIDMKEGKNGQATLDALAKEGKVLPPSPIAITPSGGRHRLFRAVPGIRNVVEFQSGRGIGLGIDVRADGGFAVMPPSVLSEHRSQDGKTLIHGAGPYRWLVPPMRADFPRLPDWAVKMLTLKPPPPHKPTVLPSPQDADGYRRQALADLHELRRTVSQMADGRHQAPFSKACAIGKYRAHGFLADAEIEAALLDACAANGALSKYAMRDLQTQIRNGLRKARADGLPPLARAHRRGC
jgi:Bifunctional DNA primase/polymerase, N-terminal